jgi:hypothetical protein
MGKLNAQIKRRFIPVLWIWIRIDLPVLDPEPDPYWECGSRSRKMEIEQNVQIPNPSFLAFKKRLLYLHWVFLDLLSTETYFRVKIQLFVTLKVGTNENGSACGRWLSIGI